MGSITHKLHKNRSVFKRQRASKFMKWRDKKRLKYLEKSLKKRWSPEIISVKWEREIGKKFSHTSIYTLIRKHCQTWSKREKRNGGSSLIQNRVGIENRPQVVNERGRFVDFEADTVLSSREGKLCLAVFVERKSRLYLFKKIPNKSAPEMTFATINILRKYNPKTITYDNGSENVFHDITNSVLNYKSFFCNSYHSWEKGAIENRNKILRQFFPKGTNFDLQSEREIRRIQAVINSRPMKTLN